MDSVPTPRLTSSQLARYRFFRTGSNTAARAFELARQPAQIEQGYPRSRRDGVDPNYMTGSSW